MSLEDDLRRMGEARAAETRPVDWRRREAVSVTGRWLVAAAAVLVIVVGAIAVFATGDESPTEVASPATTAPPTTAPPTTAPDETTPDEPSTTSEPSDDPADCTPDSTPSAEVLDRAVHLSPDRMPLDLDGDGIDDELLADEGDGSWSILARLGDGWATLDLPFAGRRLLTDAEGRPASSDLDGDGRLEFYVSGDATVVAMLVSLGCDGAPAVAEPLALDGEWCIPSGGIDTRPDGPYGWCEHRIACVDDVLVRESAVPGGDLDGRTDPEDVAWTTLEYRLLDGELVSTPGTTVFFAPDDPPPGAPTAADTGFVDCPPDDPADAPVVGLCADNPAPAGETVEILTAAWPGPEGRGVDIDQDGAQDRVLAFRDDAGTWQLMVDLGHGRSTPVRIRSGFQPPTPIISLTTRADGEVATHDLGGDGNLEFFLSGFGNTARSARAVTLVGCELRVLPSGDDAAAALEDGFGLLIGVGGGSCNPIGCLPRVSCRDGLLVVETTDPGNGEVVWETRTVRIDDGQATVVESDQTTFPADARPADAPQVEDSDVIDCRP